MMSEISSLHLQRRACVYVRQSTPTQVLEHRESTQRQYALADRAEALGWTHCSIEVIDEDLGRSGTTEEKRPGFRRLIEGVVHGEVGAVFAIEVSRLARSSQAWQRLLSLCAVANVIVVDEQVSYDPADPNDKLLLDIKGTMSEAELHWLGLRLHGARRNKARRGELRLRPPTGYVWGQHGLELDPDESVQQSIRVLFERYSVQPSVWSVARWANEHGIQIPTRHCFGDGSTELTWKPPAMSRLRDMFSNPIYAGAYVMGRHSVKKVIIDGVIREKRILIEDPEGWMVCIHEAHPGYVSWEQYLNNRQKLRDNVMRYQRGARGAPREGNALLAGLVICARCGTHARTVYSGRDRRHHYSCASERQHGGRTCWTILGAAIDHAVEQLFLQTMVPSELELSLAVQREVDAQAESLSKQWKLRIEQAQYEARRAERRYKAVDPQHRVVARTLEREWEQRLNELEQVQRDYEKAKHERRVELSKQDRECVRALARDLPKVWRSETTTQPDRKAMLRLVIEAVSVNPIEVPRRSTIVRVAWKSGAVTELEVARPRPWRTDDDTVQRIRQLAAKGVYDTYITEQLNAEGRVRNHGKPWTFAAVQRVRQRNGIPSIAPHPTGRPALPEQREDGLYSIRGAARRFGVSVQTIRKWVDNGLVSAERQRHPYFPWGILWLDIDETTAVRLEDVARTIHPRGLSGSHRAGGRNEPTVAR